MKYISMILAIVLSACSQQDPDVILVNKFWEALQANNANELKQLISEPEHAEQFSKFTINAESIDIGDKLANGNVEIIAARFCYPKVKTETVIVRTNDGMKVDAEATLLKQMREIKNAKPERKYCYTFGDKQMSGKISGMNVELVHVNRVEFNYGTHKNISFDISADPCPYHECPHITTPRILIDKLDLDGAGGNFTNEENITLFTPPHSNEIITEGSYRIGEASNGKKKLEISFTKDSENYLNGYIVF